MILLGYNKSKNKLNNQHSWYLKFPQIPHLLLMKIFLFKYHDHNQHSC